MRLFLSLLLIVASLTAVGEINDYKAISLLKEGFEYISDGKPDKAIESLTEATRYTIDKQSLSLAYRGMGHAYALYYTQARMIKLSLSTQLEYAIKAEECYRKGGSVHQAMGEQVHQAQLYLEMGEKDKGKKIFSSVIEKSGNDTTCTDVKIKALYMLSDAEADDENYARAIPLAEDAYTLAAATGRRVESRIAATMLGNIYRALKNVEKLEHWESVADSLKSDSDAILPTQNTFSRTMSGTFQELVYDRTKAMELNNNGRHQEALAVIDDVIARAGQIAVKDFDALCDIYNTRGAIRLGMRDFPTAVKDFSTAIEYAKKSPNPDIGLSDSYYYKGIALSNIPDFKAAAACLDSALTSSIHVLGQYATHTSDVYQVKANIEAFAGNKTQAASDYRHFLEIIRHNTAQKFAYLTTEERTGYWTSQSIDTSRAVAFGTALGETSSEFTDDLYSQLLFSKGILLAAESSLRHAIESDSQLQAMAIRIAQLRDKAAQGDNDGKIAMEADRLERQMTGRSASLKGYLDYLNVTADDVKSKLSKKDLAIEFYNYTKNDKSVHYIALLLRRDWSHARLVKLCTKSALDSITRDPVEFFKDDRLYSLVWKPILQVAGNDVRHIVFSPSGMIHNIAVEYLPTSSGQLMNELFDMQRVSSTRRVVLTEKAVQSHRAILFGGIDYGGLRGSAIAGFYRNADVRGAIRNIPNLPYTQVEVDDIEKTLSKNYSVDKRCKAQGSKEQLQELTATTTPSIIHLSTHGFYITSRLSLMSDDLKKQLGIAPEDDEETIALKRGGLILAKGRGQDPDDNGILTAAEISDMQLSGTKLVVLSACQTGIGVISDEGVFGLQRGFKRAGADAMIMSLWNVPDEPTQLMMSKFYALWMESGDMRTAFAKAQNELRSKYPDQPQAWAAFILLD